MEAVNNGENNYFLTKDLRWVDYHNLFNRGKVKNKKILEVHLQGDYFLLLLFFPSMPFNRRAWKTPGIFWNVYLLKYCFRAPHSQALRFSPLCEELSPGGEEKEWRTMYVIN